MMDPSNILESINDGVYVTDRDRRIVYWNKSAERITGWRVDDVVGKHCHDGMLCHEDKDGHRLCGEEYCPLHRSIVSGNSSTAPVIVFAKGRDGRRMPMRVSVAPVRTTDGEIIGGVETFRDLSEEIQDFLRAQKIQTLAVRQDLPPDDRIAVRTHYVPRDIIGGDFYAISRLDQDRYGFLLADVSGHGVPAALYTMYLRSLWEENLRKFATPADFVAILNHRLGDLIQEDEPFAAAVVGMVDLAANMLSVAGAGGPSPLLFSRDGRCRPIECSGTPLGLFKEAEYDQVQVPLSAGDCLLAFSDGAVEVSQGEGDYLDVEGLVKCLQELGYPRQKVAFEDIERAILQESNRVRLDDDLTFLEIRLAADF